MSRGFFDESKNHTYVPGEHPNHGAGLFFVGVEANGMIYGYALDEAGGTFTRVATITSGFVSVMALDYDPDTNDFWAVCDDTCLGRSVVLRIDATTGKFVVAQAYERPGDMPNLNNEGFTIASQSECAAGRKPAYWADDSETGGHAIRRGNLPCTVTPPTTTTTAAPTTTTTVAPTTTMTIAVRPICALLRLLAQLPGPIGRFFRLLPLGVCQ